MMAIADDLRPQYRDVKTLVASMVGALNLEMARKGWRGASIFDADCREKPVPSVLIVIEQGSDLLTVDAISAFLKEKRAA